METAKTKTPAAETADEVFSKPFHFEDESDEVMGIETAVYPNGNMIKRFKISDGRTVIARELLGSDSVQIDKIIMAEKGNREDLYMNALFHYAVKVDGKMIPVEDFGKMKMKDYNRIKVAVQSINF